MRWMLPKIPQWRVRLWSIHHAKLRRHMVLHQINKIGDLRVSRKQRRIWSMANLRSKRRNLKFKHLLRWRKQHNWRLKFHNIPQDNNFLASTLLISRNPWRRNTTHCNVIRSLLNKKKLRLQEPDLVLPTTLATDIPINLPNPPATSLHAQVPTFHMYCS